MQGLPCPLPLQVCPGLTSDPIQGQSQIQSRSTRANHRNCPHLAPLAPHLAPLAWESHCLSLQAARAGSGEETIEDGDGLSCFPIPRALDRALVSQHCLHVSMDGGMCPVWHLLLGHGKAQSALEGSSCGAMMAVGHFGMCSGQSRSESTTATAVAVMLRRGMRWDPHGGCLVPGS